MVGWGRYRLAGARPHLSESAARVLAVVETLAPDAHLTGLDLLAPYAHQFFVEYPHLVYTEPAALQPAAFALADAGFVVILAASGQPDTTITASLSETVILRAQPNPEQYGVHDTYAPREKAWVDALREAQRGWLPIDMTELGRVLRGLLDAGGDLRRLRNYARRMGYLDRVDAALADPASEETFTDQQHALQAGFRS